jgi:hypothetical protein
VTVCSFGLALVYDLLFRTAAETLLTIAGDPRHLGARLGITAVLWGSAMTHHPHLHMIVPGGGISLDEKRWVPCRTDFLLPVRVLSRLIVETFERGAASRAPPSPDTGVKTAMP